MRDSHGQGLPAPSVLPQLLASLESVLLAKSCLFPPPSMVDAASFYPPVR